MYDNNHKNRNTATVFHVCTSTYLMHIHNDEDRQFNMLPCINATYDMQILTFTKFKKKRFVYNPHVKQSSQFARLQEPMSNSISALPLHGCLISQRQLPRMYCLHRSVEKPT